IERLVGELATPSARVGEQRSDAAVDVDPRVASRRSRVARHPIELFLARREILRERFEHARALMEGATRERGSAVATPEVEHRVEVEPPARRDADLLAGDGVEEHRACAAAAHPLTECVALNTCQVSHQTRSSTVAIPCPTPTHIVASA